MAVYIVTYDLRQSGQNYTCITNKLESFAVHWHMQGSVWIIETSKTVSEIRDALAGCLDQNDNLFVGRLHGLSAWMGFPEKANQWLKSLLEPLLR
jgi:hypothetical protein